MPRAGKTAYYAVHKGRECGVFYTWEECQAQITGYPNAKYKKFVTLSEAEAFVRFGGASPNTNQIPPRGQCLTELGILPTSIPIKAAFTTQYEQEGDVVYCDGACSRNGTPAAVAGVGVWWGHNDPRNIHERCPGDQTNNRAELIALIRILEETPLSPKPLLIKTDSKYTIKCVTVWLHGWRKNKWKTAQGADVKNKSLIEYISALLVLRSQYGQTVKLEHVYGHVGIEGNEGADRQANMGTLLPRVPDPDWASRTKEALQTAKSLASGVIPEDGKSWSDEAVLTEEVSKVWDPSNVEVYEGDLLDDEELIQMGLTQKFD